MADTHWVDALDSVASKVLGDQLVINRALGTGGTVEVIEMLEPTFGLEVMTCRLRILPSGDLIGGHRTRSARNSAS